MSGSATESLSRVLEGVAKALGGRDRLKEIKAFHVVGSATFISSGRVHICGHWSCWFRLSQGYRQVVEIAGGTRFEQVFDSSQGQGWVLGPDNRVSPLASREQAGLAGIVSLLSGAWLFPNRFAGRIRWLGEDLHPGSQLLEYLPDTGDGCRIRLKNSLPEEISWLSAASSDPALKSTHSSRIASRTVDAKAAASSDSSQSSIRLADWTERHGVRIPSRIEQITSPALKKLLHIRNFEINPSIPDRLFAQPQPLPPTVQFPAGRDSVTVPFRLVDDRTIVDVKVNGQDPLPFFLDTGTSSSLLDRSVAKRLGLKPLCEFSGNLGGGPGTTRIDLVQGVDLQIGALVSRPRNMMVIDIDPIAHRTAGMNIYGILGGSFIRDFVVDLDYQKKEVTFFDPATYSWEGQGEQIKIAVLSGVPFAEVESAPPQGIQMVMMLDSGAHFSIIFNQPFVEKHRLLEKVSPSISTVTFGVGGEARVQVGRLEEAVLGPLCIERPVAGLALQDQGTLGETGFAGILGAQVLSRLKVRLDYGGGWMTLKPTPRFATLSDYDKSGLVLIDKPPEYKRLEVVFVVKGSPAAEAGLRKGDEIVSINRQPSDGFSLPELKDALREPGRKFEVGVRRSGKALSLHFVTRKLI